MNRGRLRPTVCGVNSTDSAPHRYGGSRPPLSRVLPISMLVAALLVFAGVYIAGSAFDIGILHSIALLGAAGTLITAFMSAALHDV